MDVEKAKHLQQSLAEKVIIENVIKSPTRIGGMDVSNNRFDPEQMIYAAAVVLAYPSLQIEETTSVSERQTFPYVPGLLGFREAPALIKAYHDLTVKPDLIMVDGHGISHPRGLGIASHIGVLLDIPTIGVAKSILVGRPAEPVGREVGSCAPLLWKGKTLGMVIRTKRGSNPLIISVGHKFTLESAVELVMSCLRKYRLPEPTRQAHLAANRHRRDTVCCVEVV